MKFLFSKPFLKTILFFLFFLNSNALLSQSITITQETDFEQLLSEKRKANATITTGDRYRIQLFSGNGDEAKKTLIGFKKENKNIDATMIFVSPNYRVLAGNYKTRIEAEKNFIALKKKYPKALLIKPTL